MINSKKNSGNLLISSLTSTSWVCGRLTDLFRECPSVFGSLGTTQKRFCKWSCSNFSWISLEHSPASRPPYLWSISLSGRRKDLDNREGCPCDSFKKHKRDSYVTFRHSQKDAAGKAEPGGQSTDPGDAQWADRPWRWQACWDTEKAKRGGQSHTHSGSCLLRNDPGQAQNLSELPFLE